MPISNLSEIKLEAGNVKSMLEDKTNKRNFTMLSSSIRIIIEIRSLSDISDLDQICTYVPKHCELDIYGPIYSYK